MDFPLQFIFQAALSLAIGGLIGLERGKQINHPLLGVRTFALVSFLGLLLTVIPFQPEVALPAIGLFGIFVFSFLYYYFKALHFEGAWGLTTALMLPFVFFLSVLVGKGFLFEAGVAAIVATFLLVEKKEVHRITNTVSKPEIIDALIFAIIAFIIYPLLPETPVAFMGQSFSLKYFWSIVVVISLVAFAAHLLLKYARQRAVFYSSILGGFVSSLAVLALFIKKNKDAGVLRSVLVNSALGAFSGDLILFAVIAPALLVKTAPFFAVVFLAFALASFFEYKQVKSVGHMVAFDKHPLSLKFTFEFAFVFFLVNLLVTWAASLGELGFVFASFIGGIASSTSVFASVAYLFLTGGITVSAALVSLAAALSASLAVKFALVYARAGGKAKGVSRQALLMFAGVLLGLLANLFISL